MSSVIAGLGALVGAFLVAGAAFAQSPPAPDTANALTEVRADIQARADRGIYPITGMNPSDARQVLSRLTSMDKDEWAREWSAQADRYMEQARSLEKSDKAAARDAYLSAWRLYMFGAWPARTSPGKEAAYRASIAAYREYGRLQDPPMQVVKIPFEGSEIVGYLRLPAGVARAPVVISMGGLDEFKEFSALNFDPAALAQGFGTFAVDMPGTGESPVKMELGSERVFTAMIDALSAMPTVDPSRIGIFGASAGGYWAALAAYREPKRLKAAVALGAPTDHYFDEDWQRQSWGTKEYLFGLKEARMFVYGTSDEASFLSKLKTFSLKTRGILDQPSAPMLVANGAKDTQVPIADLYLLLATGSPKYAWVSAKAGHTGMAPGVTPDMVDREVVAPWLAQQFAR